MSYDSTIKDGGVFIGEADSYSQIYQHDPLGWINSRGNCTDTAWFANLFTARGTEQIQAVSFYVGAANAGGEISIRTGVSGNPVSGVLSLDRQAFLFEAPGYRTVKLSSPVPINAGDKFAVIVKLTTPGYSAPIPIENPLPGYSDKARAGVGESFESYDGVFWSDLANSSPNTNVCLKAFAAPGNPPQKPVIVTQPLTQTVYIGQKATFTVSATTSTGSLSYQWCRRRCLLGETAYTAIPGATAASFTTPVLTANDSSSGYFVRVKNGSEKVDSDRVWLNVVPSISISTQPITKTVHAGEKATFSVVASSRIGKLNYQWYRSRSLLGGTVYKAIQDARGPYYTTPVLKASDDASGFFVRLTDGSMRLDSTYAWLMVSPITTSLAVPKRTSFTRVFTARPVLRQALVFSPTAWHSWECRPSPGICRDSFGPWHRSESSRIGSSGRARWRWDSSR